MKMTMNDKHKSRVKNQTNSPSGKTIGLGRKGSCKKMSFKFLVKLRRKLKKRKVSVGVNGVILA